MSTNNPLQPPDPVACWPDDLTLEAGPVAPEGDLVFESTGEPWSVARRRGDEILLEWSDVRFAVSTNRIVVDAAQPRAMADLYWNTLIATAFELRGVTCLHGFEVQSPDGTGIVVVGLSGAGKTTTGKALLARGCILVADDLVALDAGGRPTSRPFVRRVLNPGEKTPTDIGGKVREPYAIAETIPELRRVLSLDERVEHDEIKEAGPMEFVDHLLRSPHVPFEISVESAQRRLATAAAIQSTASLYIARPRSRTPEEFADLLLKGDLE